MWFSWLKDGQSLVAFQGNSSNPEMVESVLKTFPDGVDWLFIDGGHAYHEARDDYFNYFPLVRPGGYCLFHDIIGELGVVALWKEIKAAGVNVTEISHEPPYLGIGIIQKA
jgi:hypothetical protein